MRNALTVDVEEWHDTVLFRDPPAPRKTCFSRNIEDILTLLDKRGVKATFFILGELAARCPGQVRIIASCGHEIASHGYTHRSLWRLTPGEFALDLGKSRDTLGDITGAAPLGYRSPTWSLKGRGRDFLPLIREAGYSYDSSLYPSCFAAARGAPYEAVPGLTEFPPSVFKFAGLNLPFLGGTFLRWAGPAFLKGKTAALNAAGLPALLYFHTWEFDAAPPEPLPFYKRALQYYNIGSVPPKVDALLGGFNWAPIRAILNK
ncbi:MAG: polysaccharide deacetylase family protein [Elusimicrobia bacterium]|nr:polysaccharide deacetylase family protein [Elusimicrobiota bacterium]